MRRMIPVLMLVFSIGRVAAAQELSSSVIGQIEAMFAPFDHAGTPGYAVGIVRDGRLVYAKGFGRADLDHDVPISPRTSFHLASLSKQFTAAAVALLTNRRQAVPGDSGRAVLSRGEKVRRGPADQASDLFHQWADGLHLLLLAPATAE